MGFGTAAKDSETAEVEIEEVGWRIDTSQGTIEFEIVALILLDKSSAEHNLEYVSTQTMLNSFTDICLMFLIGQRAWNLAYRMEIVSLYISLVHGFHDFWDLSILRIFWVFWAFRKTHYLQRIVVMIENDDVFIKDV